MKAIILTRGRIATVDDEDFDRVNQFKWYATRQRSCYYGRRSLVRADGVRTSELLHNFILGFKGVDHKNGDGLDCRRENLRPASAQQNSQAFQCKSPGESSQFRGVSWYPRLEKWQANIRSGGKLLYLGLFADETEAARAYDAAAREGFGEFAAPNFT